MPQLISDRYLPIRELGRDQNAVIYLARDQHLGRNVTVKILTNQLSAFRLLLTFPSTHGPNLLNELTIIDSLDFGTLPSGRVYVVKEISKRKSSSGKQFWEVRTDDQINRWHRAVGIFKQACDALTTAHKTHLLHRDHTATNCFSDRPNENPGDFVKIIDFGIAIDSQAPPGTLPFSPLGRSRHAEQDLNDLFNLGKLLYYIITNEHSDNAVDPIPPAIITSSLPRALVGQICDFDLGSMQSRELDPAPWHLQGAHKAWAAALSRRTESFFSPGFTHPACLDPIPSFRPSQRLSDTESQSRRQYAARATDILRIRRSLANETSVAVIGTRGIGKTVLLHGIAEAFLQERQHGDKTVVTMLDASTAGNCVPKSFFPAFLNFLRLVERGEIDPPVGPVPISAYIGRSHAAALPPPDLAEARHGPRALIVIDDIDEILNMPQFSQSHQFLAQLRIVGAMHRVPILISSRLPLHVLHKQAYGELERAVSPAFNFMREFHLSPMTMNVVTDFLNSGEHANVLFGFTGGNPTLISLLTDVKGFKGSDVITIARTLLARSAPYFERIWQEWTADQRILLLSICDIQAQALGISRHSPLTAHRLGTSLTRNDLDWLSRCGWIAHSRSEELWRKPHDYQVENNAASGESSLAEYSIRPLSLLWWLWVKRKHMEPSENTDAIELSISAQHSSLSSRLGSNRNRNDS